MSERVFIQCGCYCQPSGWLRRRVDEHNVVGHIFEANPHQVPLIQQSIVDKGYKGKIVLHHCAVWIEAGVIDFFTGSGKKETTVASTMMRNKTSGKIDWNYPHQVQSIDFGKWIMDNCSGKRASLLMDIEGAEYSVLEKMATDGSLDLVDDIRVEFHDTKMDDPEAYKARREAILGSFKERGIIRW